MVILQGVSEVKNETVTDPNARERFMGGLAKSTNYTLKVYARNFVFEGNASQKIIRTKFEGEYSCKASCCTCLIKDSGCKARQTCAFVTGSVLTVHKQQ